MPRFYNISTTDFRPISFENVYLYGEYKKIKNFLVSNNQQELLKVLAVPSYKNNNIEWSTNTNDEIRKLDQYSQTQQDKILSQYNEFLNSYNGFVNNLRSSKNKDNKNWGELLFSLIEGTANELFSDGENIFITWGWRLLDENSKKLIPVYTPPPSILEDRSPIIEEEIDEPETIPIIEEYEEAPFEEEEKLSWLDRFYLFLKKLWWLIPMLSVIILILVLLKACENNECNPVCTDIDDRLNNMDVLLDNCDCIEEDELDSRIEREDGCSGSIQISLMWNNYNDLDLHCIEPNREEIYYQNRKSSSGGELDVDMNASNSSLEPVENICWLDVAPRGTYKVYLKHFKQKDREDDTDYIIRVKYNSTVKEFRESIRHQDGKILICEFNF